MLNGYVDCFAEFSANLPPDDRARRRLQLDQFLKSGFPSKRQEDWRYTDLAPLAEKTYALTASAASTKSAESIEALDGTERLVFINGIFDAAASTRDDLHRVVAPARQSADGIQALNAAFTTPGLDLQVPTGQQQARALHVLLKSGNASPAPVMVHQRHRIVLGDGAHATVILEFAGDGVGEKLSTQTLEIELGANASLNFYRIQHDATGSTLLTRTDVNLARDARLHAVCIDFGAGLARHDFNVDLAGVGCEAAVHGFYAPPPQAHIDNHTRIVHSAPHGRSREHFRGVIAERAKAVFSGKVVVRPGAQKTDSQQRIANLLLSRRAEVNAKPDLEIYADDVKCAHGATVGQLDEDAMEYLRSRGIDRASAKALLLRAFALEILDHIEFAPLRQRIEDSLKFPSELDTASMDKMIDADTEQVSA